MARRKSLPQRRNPVRDREKFAEAKRLADVELPMDPIETRDRIGEMPFKPFDEMWVALILDAAIHGPISVAQMAEILNTVRERYREAGIREQGGVACS